MVGARGWAALFCALVLTGLTLGAAGPALAASGATPAAASDPSGGAATIGTGEPAGAGSTAGSTLGYRPLGFSDVSSATPQYAAIEELAAFGLVSGYPDGSYKPKQDVTRAEFTKLIDIASGLGQAAQAAADRSPFSDVPGGQWYTGYVDVAAARGIVNGYTSGKFRPGADVRFDEAVTMVVRALGYPADVVGSWPAGYMAEAAEIQNSAGQFTLLSGLSLSGGQAMDRADVARLIDNMLYAVPAAQQVQVTQGNRQISTSAPALRTQATQLGFHVYFPGQDQTGMPLAGCYGNVVTGTTLTNPALNPNQVQITSLPSSGCDGAPVVGTTSNTYTLASTVALVGGTDLIDLTGYQVSFATDDAGQIVFIGAVTPGADVLTGASLGSQLSIDDVGGIGQLAGSVSQVSIEPPGDSTYQNFDVAAGMVAVPVSGTFYGSNGDNDTINAILNPNGDLISMIDTSRLTDYTDVYLTGMTTVNGLPNLQFYDGSPTVTDLGIAPGATATLDGNNVPVSQLKPGLIVSITTNSQGQAATLEASDKTVNGTISEVSLQTGGDTYLTVNGTQYEVSMSSAVYAEQGSVVGNLDGGAVNALANNTATLYLGSDGEVGYVSLADADSVVGMALNAARSGSLTASSVLEVESGSGVVTAYPLDPTQTGLYVAPGDIVQLTLNAANGTADVLDYSQSGENSDVFGTAREPALVEGVLGNEIQVLPGGSTTPVDLFVPGTAPVFEGQGGGAYGIDNLVVDISGDPNAGIAPTASTTTLAAIQPGYDVTLGATAAGTVEGIVELSGTPGNPAASAVRVDGTVDVAVTTAAVATGGQLGTADVAPLGATAPMQVSIESNGADTAIGSSAGTDASVFGLSTIGQTLVESVYDNPADLTQSSQLTFSSLTTDGNNNPAFTTDGGPQFAYGSGTVVLNVPDDQVEPIGSLIPGQTIIVYSQGIPGLSASDSGLAQFVEVVQTTTNVATLNAGTPGLSVSLTATGTQVTVPTVTGAVYAAVYSAVYDEYAVSATLSDSPGGLPVAVVSVANSQSNAYASATYVPAGGSVPPTTTTQAVAGDGDTSYTAFVLVPHDLHETTTVTVSAFGASSGTVVGSSQISD